MDEQGEAAALAATHSKRDAVAGWPLGFAGSSAMNVAQDKQRLLRLEIRPETLVRGDVFWQWGRLKQGQGQDLTEPRGDDLKCGTDGPGTEGAAGAGKPPPVLAGHQGQVGYRGGATGRSVVLNIVSFVVAHTAANFCAVRLGQLWSVILLTSALLPKSPYPTSDRGM